MFNHIKSTQSQRILIILSFTQNGFQGAATVQKLNFPIKSEQQYLSIIQFLSHLKVFQSYEMSQSVSGAKTAVTAQLICAFVFAQAKIWYSHNAAHMSSLLKYTSKIP